jgi:hypothetical protein
MADLQMFPPHGHPSPEAKIARLEAHVFHLSLKQKEQEDEFRELKKDREALLRYILWRLVIFSGLLIGALVSNGSSDGSTLKGISSALTGSLGL